MILGLPLAMWFGILTIISLFVTLGLGLAVHKFQKPLLPQHKAFAMATVSLAIVHLVLVILLFFFHKVI